MIYIVEDDSNISELVVYTLKMAGFDAQSFTCGTELFKQLENNIPELILLDIMLPGEDGIIILKKIRKTFQTHKIPVIMLTAKGSEYDKVTGLDCGADDYVTKPFGMMELVSRIKAVLRRYSDFQGINFWKVSGDMILTVKPELLTFMSVLCARSWVTAETLLKRFGVSDIE